MIVALLQKNLSAKNPTRLHVLRIFALLFVAALVTQGGCGTRRVVEKPIRYASTIDDLNHLTARLALPTVSNSEKPPLVVMMHGFTQDASHFDESVLDRWACYGIATLVVDMRGRRTSDGTPDAGGREIQDIIDAIDHVLVAYPGRFDRDNVHIVGYSGGGANAMLAAARFPERFGLVASFFGISDYGNTDDGWWYTNPERRPKLTEWIGDREENPLRYTSRNATLGIANFPGPLLVFHDAGDTNVPSINSERIKQVREETFLSITGEGDRIRWLHDLPNGDSPLIAAEPQIVSLIADTRNTKIGDEWAGVVLGYLVTSRFNVWLGDGTAGIATVDWNANRDPQLIVDTKSKQADVQVTGDVTFEVLHNDN